MSAGHLAQRRSRRGELEALEDASRDVRNFDSRQEADRGAAAGAAKHVDLEDAAEAVNAALKQHLTAV